MRMLKNLCERCHSDPALRERNLSPEAKDLRDSSLSANKNGGLLGMTGEAGFSASRYRRSDFELPSGALL